MLTREKLTEWRTRWACGCVLDDAEMVDELLDFGEEMLPIRDALLALLAAEEKTNGLLGDAETIPEGSEVDKSFTDQDVAHKALWELARELGETEVEP